MSIYKEQRKNDMKRSDVIRTLQVNFNRMRADDAAAIFDAVVEEMINGIANNNRIEIRGIGSFQSRLRASKNGYNPSTGKMVHLEAGRTILFKPSRELTKKMNGIKNVFWNKKS